MKVGRRTRRETDYTADKWSMIHKWGLDRGYQLDEQKSTEGRLIYKKRFNWMMPATFMEMSREGKKLKLDFWVNTDAYLVVSLLTFRPSEVRLDRGGLAGALPRKMARKIVNELMARLQLEKIK